MVHNKHLMAQKYGFYQVDAFTSKPFSGNPAAICVLSEWPGDPVLQGIASDNNLSETAFLKPVDEDYEIRWFTPTTEVALCGHGTLASAHVVFEYLHPQWNEVVFHTRYSGDLFLASKDGQIAMDLPKVPLERKVNTHGLSQLNTNVEGVYESDKLILRLEDEEAVARFEPDDGLLGRMHEFGVGITAPSSTAGYDFVSRFFAPNAGIPEDPVTGSLHCSLAELWEQELGKATMKAKQLSPRQGELTVSVEGERVVIKGQARTVIQGEYFP